jgi:hypothetical protein
VSAINNQLQSSRFHLDIGLRDGDTVSYLFSGNINHLSVAGVINMR